MIRLLKGAGTGGADLAAIMGGGGGGGLGTPVGLTVIAPIPNGLAGAIEKQGSHSQ